MNRRVAFALALALLFTGVVAGHAEVAITSPNGVGSAAVDLNRSGFRTGQTISYQGTLRFSGTAPAQVDLYFGILLPDGVTLFSLVQESPGVFSGVVGPSPIPFQANVPFTDHVVNFAYRFVGFEPVGIYYAYAAAVVAGSDPSQTSNWLSIAVQSFQFSTTPIPATAGTTYYVATTGNDSNPGTDTLPFRTISRGVKVLKPGDTLFARGGTYAEAIQDIPSGTSWSAPVTVAAYPGETVTVKPGATGWPAVYLYNRSYIVLDGLIIDSVNIGTYYTNIEIGGTSHHIRIQNSESKNSPTGHGIYIGRNTAYNEVLTTAIHDNGSTDFDHGIYIKGNNNLIEGNDIYRNAGWGVQIYADVGTGSPSNNIIRNNKIHDNARIGKRGTGIILSSGNGNQAYNNLIWGNAGGIQVAFNAPTGSEIYNNTIYANREYGIEIGSDATNSIIKNNILYQNGGTQFNNSGTGTQSSNNLIGGDPAFVNVSAYDFHLQRGSPAIDAGVTLQVVTTDFDGNARPHGAAPDLGAYEFIGP